MFLGVPYMPFFLIVGGLFLLSMYTNFWFLASIPVAVFVMRHMAACGCSLPTTIAPNLRLSAD